MAAILRPAKIQFAAPGLLEACEQLQHRPKCFNKFEKKTSGRSFCTTLATQSQATAFVIGKEDIASAHARTSRRCHDFAEAAATWSLGFVRASQHIFT